MTTAHIKALDLFAGTGWGVACQRLGIKEVGVEIMPEAVATRTANGMETIYRDVWDGLTLTAEQHREQYGSYGLLIASPPCQTFSLAGKGAGRAALDEVLEAIELHAYKDADALKAFGASHDMRTALVLSPLAYVWRDRPRLVAMEQVPTVLPVWEACAEVMREWGYDVKVEVLNAEQYGVPQTRKRAILVARRCGAVHMPTPTHSKYYSRTPEKLDAGVQKWVSMAEALGWGDSSQTICHGVQQHSARRPMTEPAATIAFGHDSASVGFVSAAVGDHLAVRAAKRDGGFDPVSVEQAAILQSYPGGRGLTDRPSPTITGGGTEAGGAEPIAKYHERYTSAPGWVGVTDRLTTDEAAALQSYPTVVRTSMGKPKDDDRNGSHELDPFNRPAHTLTSKSESWLIKDGAAGWDEAEKLTASQASALQSYPTGAAKNMGRGMVERYGDRPGRSINNPAFTVRASAGGTEPGGFVFKNDDGTTRKADVPEVSALQSYERPFVWCGTKTKQFLQIGNAVPPLLAEHILAALVGIPTTQEVRS